jgi:hypothetical protein
VQSGRKNGFFPGNKRIILGESAVVSRGLVRLCLDIASEVQGERRVEHVRTLLSRSLHSPLQLKCNGKVTTMGNRFYDFPRFLTDIDALLVSNHGSPR